MSTRKRKSAPKRLATRTGPPRPPRQPRVTTGRIRGYPALLGGLLAEAPSESLISLTMPHLWAQLVDGQAGNACVDATYVLGYAFGILGIESRVLPVDLVITDSKGRTTFHGHPEPGWDHNGEYTGHVVLGLPEGQRLVDATIEQYPGVARHKQGPLIGRIATTTHPGLDPFTPGGHSMVQRQDTVLVYTWAAGEHAEALAAYPLIHDAQDQYATVGLRLASHALHYYTKDSVIERALQVPHVRARALIAATRDCPATPDDIGDIWFSTPVGQLKLDQIPLPEGTPAPRTPR